MIEDESFDEIDEALEITDRGAEIMKKEPCLLYTSPSPRDS